MLAGAGTSGRLARGDAAQARHGAASRLAILAGTVVLFRVVPKGFIPSEDTGFLNGTTEGAEGLSFEAMVAHQKAVAAVLAQDPERRGLHVQRGRRRPDLVEQPGPRSSSA